MTKMAKRNKAILWSCVAAIAALLVALVFVGVTFARYSSTNTGSGSATVALWDVNATPAEVSSSAFSPSAESPENKDATNARTNTSDYIEVATLVNNGNVEATVAINEVTSEDITLVFYTTACNTCIDSNGLWTGNTCSCETDPSKTGYCDFCVGYATYGTTAVNHFSLTLAYNNDGGDSYTDLTDNTTFTVAAGETEYLYAKVTWTSDIIDCVGTAADAFDTWCGHYLSSISFVITFEAYQSTALGGDAS